MLTSLHLVDHLRPSCLQVASKMASSRSRCRFGAILAASGNPKTLIFLRCLYVFAYLAFSLQGRLRSPKMAQDGPRMAPRWLQDGPQMAPGGSQDCPKTVPRRLQVASEAILALPSLYLCDENSRGSPKMPPRSLQEPPKRPPRGPKRPQEAP